MHTTVQGFVMSSSNGVRRSAEAAPLLPGKDRAVTVLRRLSSGVGSTERGHFAMRVIYFMPN
jgi:hypothetical protein